MKRGSVGEYLWMEERQLYGLDVRVAHRVKMAKVECRTHQRAMTAAREKSERALGTLANLDHSYTMAMVLALLFRSIQSLLHCRTSLIVLLSDRRRIWLFR